MGNEQKGRFSIEEKTITITVNRIFERSYRGVQAKHLTQEVVSESKLLDALV